MKSENGRNSVSSASWDLKIGERVNNTLIISQKQFPGHGGAYISRKTEKTLQNMRKHQHVPETAALNGLIIKAEWKALRRPPIGIGKPPSLSFFSTKVSSQPRFASDHRPTFHCVRHHTRRGIEGGTIFLPAARFKPGFASCSRCFFFNYYFLSYSSSNLGVCLTSGSLAAWLACHATWARLSVMNAR